MRQIWIITKRELAAYFATPVAFVFIAIFVALILISLYMPIFSIRGTMQS